MAESLDSWFEREILVHEESLVRYLQRIWPKREEVDDLRQDIYVRVYEAGMKARPVAAKSFLFTTARNLMADRVRRGRIVSIDATGDLEVLNVLLDEISPEQRTSARQELQRLAQAFDQLPPKCREVMWMRRVEEISIRAAADRLGVSEGTIEKHLARGTELLASYLFGGKEAQVSRSEQFDGESEQHEVSHGRQ
ncbi:RNA polymerase sigma factor [Steroidobacter sp.]|uniref:RNA polymerase sigma factor n=1 Tax=Steroidobacter sp. TaxID=1978227 RepID=UPI001A36DBC0|nr:sigma-70 family RNA polymerase sigma factor [Steroidobacter sp.]MBL8268476.1 sigma-70 family RNA polymerase sigma factor [Steroidobacter sp.]